MLKAKTRWKVKKTDESVVQQLKDQLSISELTARLLVNRGIETVEKANHFLHVETFSFHDPFLLGGMKEVVSRIKEAISRNERILIFGDYDADGVTSTALMVYLMRELEADFLTYIPNRFTEGYGPNETAFRWAKQQGVSLIVTVDTGIAAVYEAEIAHQLGIDLIITDHHEPPPTLPKAYAIVNPRKPGCTYPFKGLAGVGVAFKLAHALLGQAPYKWLDLAAIGTIADLVPLRDENRRIAVEGMKLLAQREKVGMKALLEVCGIKGWELTAGQIGFAIAPRINAAGRLDSAEPALKLLISTDAEEAEVNAEKIDLLNKERQEIVNETTKEALALIEDRGLIDQVIVVAKEGWNPGVIGIVASRIVERYYRPAIVLAIESETNTAKGSARSIEAFDLYTSLSACRELLPHFGGHTMAAGLSISSQDIDELRKQLNELAAKKLTEEDFIPVSTIDSICNLEEVTIETIEEISKLVPFGVDNPAPKFLIENTMLSQVRKIGSEKNHLKFQLKENDISLDGVGFRVGELFHEVNPGANVSVIGEFAINEWNGFRKPQLILSDMAVDEWQLFDFREVRDLKSKLLILLKEKVTLVSFRNETIDLLGLSELQANVINPINSDNDVTETDLAYIVLLDLPYEEKQLTEWYRALIHPERTYVVFHNNVEHYFTANPTRDQFKWYYAFLLKRKSFPLKKVAELAKYKGWGAGTIEFMSKVFLDLGFVAVKDDFIFIVEQPKKHDLNDSSIYKEKQALIQLEKDLLYSSYESLKRWFQELDHCQSGEEATN